MTSFATLAIASRGNTPVPVSTGGRGLERSLFAQVCVNVITHRSTASRPDVSVQKSSAAVVD